MLREIPTGLRLFGQWIEADPVEIEPAHLTGPQSGGIVRIATSMPDTPNPATDPDLRVLLERWQRYMRTVCDYSALHVKKCAADVEKIAGAAGWKHPRDMTTSSLVEWATRFIEASSAAGKSGRKRAKNMASSARAFASWCKMERIIDATDLHDARLPTVRKCHRGKGARAFSIDEVRSLILAAERMEATTKKAGKFGPNRSVLYCFLAHTGLRYSEAMRLTWADVDLERAVLCVTRDKAGRSDEIPIGAEAVQALRDLEGWSGGGGGPAPHQAATKPPSGIFRKVSHHTLEADMERAGVVGAAGGKAGQWHRFRKFSVTERLRQGQDAKKVQRLARHASLDLTTSVYNDLELDELRGTADSLGRLNGFLEKSSCNRGEVTIDLSNHIESGHMTNAPHNQTPRRDGEAGLRCGNQVHVTPAPLESGCPGRSAGRALPPVRIVMENGAGGNRTPGYSSNRKDARCSGTSPSEAVVASTPDRPVTPEPRSSGPSDHAQSPSEAGDSRSTTCAVSGKSDSPPCVTTAWCDSNTLGRGGNAAAPLDLTGRAGSCPADGCVTSGRDRTNCANPITTCDVGNDSLRAESAGEPCSHDTGTAPTAGTRREVERSVGFAGVVQPGRTPPVSLATDDVEVARSNRSPGIVSDPVPHEAGAVGRDAAAPVFPLRDGAATTAASPLSPDHLIAQTKAAAFAAEEARLHGDKTTMRKTLRFIAAAASLAAASITVGVTGGYDDGLFGWTNGKQCSIANGCITKPTVAMCLDCCDFYCQSVLTECFDTCLPDEPAAIMAVRDADKAIRAGVWTTENISTLQRAQHSARKRVRDMARALSEESVLRSMLVQPAVPGRGEPDQHTTADSIVSPFTLL